MFKIKEVSIYFPQPRRILYFYKLQNDMVIKVRASYNSKNLAEKLTFPEFLESNAISFDRPLEEPIFLKQTDITLSN